MSGPVHSRRSPLITVMLRAAEKAARGLTRDFGEAEQLQVSRKGPADFVSAADHDAERTLRTELSRARPDYGLLMEESGETPGTGPRRWIVDPLDGTTNFLHGIPHFAISIAVEENKAIIAGVVYDPIKDEMFWAEDGRGAWLESSGRPGRRLRVSGRRALDDAVIGTGTPFRGHGDHDRYLAELREIMAQTAGVRRLGAAALDLCYVAAGRFDAFWETPLNPWDVAAGTLIVREAGGYVSEIDGGRDPVFGASILAANRHLHLHLGKLLRGIKPTSTPPAA